MSMTLRILREVTKRAAGGMVTLVGGDCGTEMGEYKL